MSDDDKQPAFRLVGGAADALEQFTEYYGCTKQEALYVAVAFLRSLVPPSGKTRKTYLTPSQLADGILAGNLRGMINRAEAQTQ